MIRGRVVETRENKEGKTIKIHCEKPWKGNSYEDYWLPNNEGIFQLDDLVWIKIEKDNDE